MAELPLVNGLTDAFRQRNWAVVGPSQQAAQLEGSKVFSKEFLKRHGIPTAKMYGTYDSPTAVYRALAGGDQGGWIVCRQGCLLGARLRGRERFCRTRDGKERTGAGRKAHSPGRDAGRRRAIVYHSHGWKPVCATRADARSQARLRWKPRLKHGRHGGLLDG